MINLKNIRIKIKYDEKLNIKERLIKILRVCKVTKGRRYFTFSCIMVVGNYAGIVGYGIGKSTQIIDSINKAIAKAKKNLFKIKIINNTIPHEIQAKYCSSLVYLKPAHIGTGIVAGFVVRCILQSAGIVNIITKCRKSSNIQNCIKATFTALINLRHIKDITQERGISKKKLIYG